MGDISDRKSCVFPLQIASVVLGLISTFAINSLMCPVKSSFANSSEYTINFTFERLISLLVRVFTLELARYRDGALTV